MCEARICLVAAMVENHTFVYVRQYFAPETHPAELVDYYERITMDNKALMREKMKQCHDWDMLLRMPLSYLSPFEPPFSP